MGQCFLDYDGLKKFWKVVRDNTVPMRGNDLGTNSTAIGEGSYAGGVNSTAIGKGSYAGGTNSTAIGKGSYAGIFNEDDSDKSTYPYITWQWVPTEKFTVSATSTTIQAGDYYGFPLKRNENVTWSMGDGQVKTYTNTSTDYELLVVIKETNTANKTNLIFYGNTTAPYNISKTLIAGKHIMSSFAEYLKSVSKMAINGEVYYQVIICGSSPFQTYYDFTQPVKVMCATKVKKVSAYSGGYSFVSGYYSAAGGFCSFVSGRQSVGGSHSFASGAYSVASNSYSVAIGCGSVASGSYSTAIGEGSIVNGNYSTSLAQRGIVNNDYQTVVGRYNDPIDGLFVVGDGKDSNNRSNALVIDKIGTINGGAINGGSSKWSITKDGQATFTNLVIDNDDITGGNGNNYVLLAGGGLKLVSDFGSGSGSGSGGTTSSTPYPLTIKINNTSKSFNGSAAVTVDITPANIGAAPVSHTHSDYALVDHTHSDYLSLDGGTLTGDLTTSGVLKATMIKKSGSNSTNDFVLLAGGGTKRLSEIGSGSGSVSGDYLTKSFSVNTTSTPYWDYGMWLEGSLDGFIGFCSTPAVMDGPSPTPAYSGISLNWDGSPGNPSNGVRINGDTFTYKSYPILHSNNFNNYVPSKTGGGASGTWDISISGNAATTTKLSTARTLWGNSFDGTGNIDGDIVFNKPGSLSTVSQGIRLNKAGTSSVGVAVPAEGFIGFTAEKGIQPNFHGISLGWGTNPEKSASSVRINDTTFTYKGNKILHTGIVNLPSTFGVKIQIDSETTAHVTEHFGDYVIASTTSNDHDAFIDVVDTILTENHYITSVYISITNNKLKTLLTNGFVKFGYSIKDDGIQQMRILQSNFDGTILYIEYIHTENTAAAYSTCFDCIWEVWK